MADPLAALIIGHSLPLDSGFVPAYYGYTIAQWSQMSTLFCTLYADSDASSDADLNAESDAQKNVKKNAKKFAKNLIHQCGHGRLRACGQVEVQISCRGAAKKS